MTNKLWKLNNNFLRTDEFGNHLKGNYGFCQEHCHNTEDRKVEENVQQQQQVVFSEELPLILSDPLNQWNIGSIKQC